MATITSILIFAVALMVFFYPLAAMFSFYGEDGFYRFQKDRFIFISSALGVFALITAIIFVVAVPEASAQDTASAPTVSVAEATPVDLPVTPAQ